MAYSKHSKSTAVRAKLNHPVIDGDGHWLEPIPIFLEYLREVGGPSIVDKFVSKAKDTSWYEMEPAERMDRRPHRPTWWGEPANSLDRASALLRAPGRLRNRLCPRLHLPRALLRLESRRGAAPCGGTRGEPDERGDVPSLRGPYDTRRRGARAHAAGGDRRGDLRGARARPQGRHDRQPRAALRARRRAGGEGPRRP